MIAMGEDPVHVGDSLHHIHLVSWDRFAMIFHDAFALGVWHGQDERQCQGYFLLACMAAIKDHLSPFTIKTECLGFQIALTSPSEFLACCCPNAFSGTCMA